MTSWGLRSKVHACLCTHPPIAARQAAALPVGRTLHCEGGLDGRAVDCSGVDRDCTVATDALMLDRCRARPRPKRLSVCQSSTVPFPSTAGDFPDGGATGPVDLPPPDMGNLPDIAKALREVSPFQRDRVAEQLLRNNYLRRLLDLFRVEPFSFAQHAPLHLRLGHAHSDAPGAVESALKGAAGLSV